MKKETITMAHGSGGLDSAELMQTVFAKHFGNEILGRLEDSAVVTLPQGIALPPRLAISTDSFVVSPLVFPGGDIGKLAVCGTVNDVLMSGAAPKYLTCGFIIEAGLPIELLDSLCASFASAAARAGVMVVAGDTKVVESRGEGGGLTINTTGIGIAQAAQGGGSPVLPTPSGIRPGDSILVSGNLGDHHAAILSARMGVKNTITSDCALLTPVLAALRGAGVPVHAMRDVTRGGLATVLNELAKASGASIELAEEAVPVSPEVRAFCGIMGLDPLYMGNEGKLVLAVAPEDEPRALAAMRETQIAKGAVRIARAKAGAAGIPVAMRTRVGGTVRVDVLYGEGLPRIC
ncbi:MAG: hydrogenase expression/formation protein HypE [Clostridiales Family XIII bacterium]|jgi:hydrogenase expression/formation protein HypE|nr:hydrogenase expression/formation protein HypE [Clostridiales Family XIII bacterium]